MASEIRGTVISFKAENAFATAYVVCTLGTNEDEVDLPAATTDQPLGVVQDTADAGEAIPVMINGVTKIVANGPFSKGDLLAIAATTGKVDTVSGLDSSFDFSSASKQQPIGVALQAATAANEIVSMLIRPLFFPWA